MTSRMVTFNVLRFDPAEDAAPHFQSYTLDVSEGVTVLEALLRIQEEQDGTLAFRYACRGAVCGSCAMRINGHTDLSCRTQVLGLEVETITLEPLRNFPVLRDLVVDIIPFLEKYEFVGSWLEPAEAPPEREYIVAPEAWPEAAPYANCILCGCCHDVCPAAERDPAYLGPAALAGHYRFLTDARDGAGPQRLARVDSQPGVWGCDMVWNCVKICPKGVPPTEGIGKSRARIRRAQKARPQT